MLFASHVNCVPHCTVWVKDASLFGWRVNVSTLWDLGGAQHNPYFTLTHVKVSLGAVGIMGLVRTCFFRNRGIVKFLLRVIYRLKLGRADLIGAHLLIHRCLLFGKYGIILCNDHPVLICIRLIVEPLLSHA